MLRLVLYRLGRCKVPEDDRTQAQREAPQKKQRAPPVVLRFCSESQNKTELSAKWAVFPPLRLG